MYLPQLSSCGPIEAREQGSVPELLMETFRNYQVAAPLKLVRQAYGVAYLVPSATIKLRPH